MGAGELMPSATLRQQATVGNDLGIEVDDALVLSEQTGLTEPDADQSRDRNNAKQQVTSISNERGNRRRTSGRGGAAPMSISRQTAAPKQNTLNSTTHGSRQQ